MVWDEDESETVLEYIQCLERSGKQSDTGATWCVSALSERISAKWTMNIDEYNDYPTATYKNTPAVTLANWIHFHTVENQERSKLDRK